MTIKRDGLHQTVSCVAVHSSHYDSQAWFRATTIVKPDKKIRLFHPRVLHENSQNNTNEASYFLVL